MGKFAYSEELKSLVMRLFAEQESSTLADSLDEGRWDFVEMYLQGVTKPPTWQEVLSKLTCRGVFDLKISAQRAVEAERLLRIAQNERLTFENERSKAA